MASKSNIVRVGDVEIMQLSDGMLEFDLCNFFPTIPGEDWTPYASHLTQEHKVRFNLGSYLIRSSGRTILVDTGLGPRPAETPDVPWGQLLHDFAANGVRPEEVDMVVMTHLHRDHIGWNVLREGQRYVPTFPNARYWMSRKDWDTSHQPDVQPQRYPNAPTCAWPLEELGLIEFMHGEHSITRELTAVPTPGHTPGHVSVRLACGGAEAVITGDLMHCPVQVAEPDWCSHFDSDPDQARKTRRAFCERYANTAVAVLGTHFHHPTAGRIVGHGSTWRFVI